MTYGASSSICPRMSQKPISELRRRMLEDMAVRKFSETTCRNYIRHITEFAKFLGRSPDMATAV
jgi:integrase/recombinase XerD